MSKSCFLYSVSIFIVTLSHSAAHSNQLLIDLSQPPDYKTHRISSYDRSGGNQDWISIEPGETKVLAEINGSGAITHIWNTVNAERYYPRMLILRMYWDGETTPSVEAPLGDFFGVGHGINRPFQSTTVAVSSEGRARNCYWYMPFKDSAKITITHEGFQRVGKFYYYVDYRTDESIQEDSLYFHAHYRQSTPNPEVDLKGKNTDGKSNYVVLETEGKGKYVGTVLSTQMNADGWFGEGDDMFFIDGDEQPSIIGTGTEDYFNDAWGFRAFDFPYHGVSLWEGTKTGDRGTAYKWHVTDPVAFQQSLKFTIEHGHANNRRDDWYSVAFWYQTLPSPKPPVMVNVFERLPDEGQLYAQRLFLNQELLVHIENQRFNDAVNRIDLYLEEEPDANQYGYWSLRKGMLLKYQGLTESAELEFELAAEKSGTDPTNKKTIEQDAPQIHQAAVQEEKALESLRTAQLYVVAEWQDTYEIYLDGDVIHSDFGGQGVSQTELNIGRGDHTIAVKYIRNSPLGNFSLLLSHRDGYIWTDESWKASDFEQDDWTERRFDDSQWENAGVIGRLGQGHWQSVREPFAFLTAILHTPVIWSKKQSSPQTVYFRHSF